MLPATSMKEHSMSSASPTGRWLEHWAVRDELAQLQQLGLMPTSGGVGPLGV
jgi:hypothetical protein